MKLWSVLTLLVALGCKREGAAPKEHPHEEPRPTASGEQHEEAPGAHDELVKRVKLSDAVARDAKLEVAPARREALSEVLTLPGEIAADPDRLARIASPAPGRIEEVRIKEGASVKKGDVLVVVRVPEVGRVRSSIAATETRAKAARANVERLAALLEKRLVSEQEAVDARAEADSLELEARSLREQLGALGAGASGAFSVTLRAPIAATVIARDAVVGQPVSTDQTLGTLAALDEVWFLGRVFEKDLGRVRAGARADIHLNAYPAEHFEGTVEYLGQQVDPSARTLTARMRLKNDAGLLRIGLFGTAQVGEEGPPGAPPRLVVPRTAVTEIAGKTLVFVRESNGEYAVHAVTLGREAPGKVEVLEGLREGELVVTNGVFTLKSIVLKGSFAEEE